MASKRIMKTTVDWAAFSAIVPKDQMPQFTQFKIKSDIYSRSVYAKPDSLPKINWDQYKGRIEIPGMVEDFQKKYESMNIPYPTDKYSQKINDIEIEADKEYKVFCTESDARIVDVKKSLEIWDKIPRFVDMTIEEFGDHFPELAQFDMDNPKMFPGTPEFQPDYDHGQVEDH